MSYSNWFLAHGKKHADIMAKLQHLTDDEILSYFKFENMCLQEPDFCPLYAQGKKCHEMEDLNCYLCACPHFRFHDDGLWEAEGKQCYSTCHISARKGKKSVSAEAIHHDCSDCLLPHQEAFIRTVFQREWFRIMRSCSV